MSLSSEVFPTHAHAAGEVLPGDPWTEPHFEAVLFWRTLHAPARIWAPLLGDRFGRNFAAHGDLLTAMAQPRTVDDVREAVRDLCIEPANQRPRRRSGHMRVRTGN